MSMEPLDVDLNRRWRWILDIVFAGLLALGLQRFTDGYQSLFSRDAQRIVLTLLSAVGVMAFFAYDLTVLHVLTLPDWQPYCYSRASAVRFSLDVILMAPLLGLILLPGLSPGPWHATLRILVAVTIWHVCAGCWHLLAYREIPRGRLSEGIQAHLKALPAYWIPVLVALTAKRYFLGHQGSWLGGVNSFPCLAVLSLSLVAVAAWRTFHVIKNVRPSITNNSVA